jgi:hypothetical protein
VERNQARAELNKQQATKAAADYEAAETAAALEKQQQQEPTIFIHCYEDEVREAADLMISPLQKLLDNAVTECRALVVKWPFCFVFYLPCEVKRVISIVSLALFEENHGLPLLHVH